MSRSCSEWLIIYEDHTTEVCKGETIRDIIGNVKGDSDSIQSIIFIN